MTLKINNKLILFCFSSQVPHIIDALLFTCVENVLKKHNNANAHLLDTTIMDTLCSYGSPH
jgi:hypothetical protein